MAVDDARWQLCLSCAGSRLSFPRPLPQVDAEDLQVSSSPDSFLRAGDVWGMCYQILDSKVSAVVV